MFFEAWDEQLVAALNEPFATADHKTKVQGGSEITFVDVHKYKERLNATVGPHGWACRVRLEAFGGKLVCTTAVTVLGVTKENVGDEVEVPELNERGNEKIIGAPVTNSYAQAFKRTCSDFGLGAYLYDKEMRDAITRSLGHTAQRESNPNVNLWDKVMPFGKTKGKKLGDLPTKELRTTRAWCVKTDAGKFSDLIEAIDATLARKAETAVTGSPAGYDDFAPPTFPGDDDSDLPF